MPIAFGAGAHSTSMLRYIYSVIRLVLLLLIPSILWVPTISAQETNRILIVHAELESEGWYRNFDRTLVDYFSAEQDSGTVVITRNLELSRAQTPAILQRIKRDLELEIREIGIDVVIAVLPSASNFVLSLDNPNQTPIILVVPDDAVAENSDLPSNVGVVASSVRSAMTQTVDQILSLRPNTETIEIIAGNHPTNLIYVDYMEQTAQAYSNRVQFNFHVGVEPGVLMQRVSQLPETASVITLPYSRYGDQPNLLSPAITQEVNLASSVPVFMIMDNGIELGAVGGHFTSSSAYALAAADFVQKALAGQAIAGVQSRDAASSIYDWNGIQRWDLQTERLQGPVEVVNEPVSFWREFPIITTLILNVILALVALAIFQSVLLRRSERARQLVETSERSARESEEKYRLLASNTVDVIWVWDPQQRKMVYCSPSVEHTIGYTVDELMQLNMEDIMTPESFERCVEAFYKKKPQETVFETNYFAKAGHIVSCEIAMRPTKVEDGKALEWIGVSRDITKRKIEEQQRQQLEVQVRQTQKFESLGTLAGGIAHDFNNILSVMMGTVDVLKNTMVLDKSSTRHLDRLMSASEKAKGLVQQILTFSRQSESEKVVTDIKTLIDECLGIMAAGIQRNITFEKLLCSEELLIKADQSQISQVVVNLITNAYEATENSGHITLSLQGETLSETAHFGFCSLPAGRYAKITVKDNGCGISAANLEKIFDPFYTSKDMGNGLGLAIVQGIVAEHGGGINIESKEGEGSCFSVYLPLTDEAPLLQNDQSLEVARSTGCRVLVVDDQEEVREVITTMLDSLGHSSTTCHNADSALYVLDQEDEGFDLIITDYSMPGKSGLELSKICAERHDGIPIVIITGFGEDMLENLGPQDGVVGVLDKPFNLANLNNLVNQHVYGTGLH